MTIQPATQQSHPIPQGKSGCGMISVLAVSILSLFLGIAIGGGTLAFVAARNPDVAESMGLKQPVTTPEVQKKSNSTEYGLIYPVEESLRIEGSLSKKEVTNVVTEKRYNLRTCYSEALKKSPKLTGEMFIQFRVAKTSGKASATIIRQSTIDNPSLKSCIVNKINTWKFPGGKERDSSVKLDLLLVPISSGG